MVGAGEQLSMNITETFRLLKSPMYSNLAPLCIRQERHVVAGLSQEIVFYTEPVQSKLKSAALKTDSAEGEAVLGLGPPAKI